MTNQRKKKAFEKKMARWDKRFAKIAQPRKRFGKKTAKKYYNYRKSGYATKIEAQKVANKLRARATHIRARVVKAPKGMKNKWLVYSNRKLIER
jgi:protoporphyrinogen oxidase